MEYILRQRFEFLTLLTLLQDGGQEAQRRSGVSVKTMCCSPTATA